MYCELEVVVQRGTMISAKGDLPRSQGSARHQHLADAALVSLEASCRNR